MRASTFIAWAESVPSALRAPLAVTDTTAGARGARLARRLAMTGLDRAFLASLALATNQCEARLAHARLHLSLDAQRVGLSGFACHLLGSIANIGGGGVASYAKLPVSSGHAESHLTVCTKSAPTIVGGAVVNLCAATLCVGVTSEVGITLTFVLTRTGENTASVYGAPVDAVAVVLRGACVAISRETELASAANVASTSHIAPGVGGAYTIVQRARIDRVAHKTAALEA